jgi:hypothetical protein
MLFGLPVNQAGQATGDNIISHAHCMLHTKGCRHTLRICNGYCISTATTVTRMCLNITLNYFGSIVEQNLDSTDFIFLMLALGLMTLQGVGCATLGP